MEENRKHKVFITVVSMVTVCGCVPISDLLDRASQRSDKLHSLSTTLTYDLDSHLPLIGRIIMPRPSMCHTSSLQTPNDKEQALHLSETDLLVLARSLLQAWTNPLLVLSNEADSLPVSARTTISNKILELQQQSKSLEDGLDILSGKMGPAAQVISSVPYEGNSVGHSVGHDNISRLANFNFLLTCFRRDSHKIDSFLKVLRCRAAMRPDMC